MVKRSRKTIKKSDPLLILSKLTLKDRLVYYMLVGTRHYYTQASISRKLGIPKSTVSNITDRLLASKAITKHKGDKHNIIYQKGINHMTVDRHVKIDIENGSYDRYLNHQVVTESELRHPYTPTFRSHLGNGGWIHVPVLQEGKLESYEVDGKPMVLFGLTSPHCGMRGLKTWNNKIYTDSGWMSIRYLKGINTGSMTFGISPDGISVDGKSIGCLSDHMLDMFYGFVKPIFDNMEKYGSWIFKKDSCGNYVFDSKAKPEYGADEYMTEIMTGLRGKNLGIPGKSFEWYDRSSEAGPGGEYELADPSYVEAICHSPETYMKVQLMEGEINVIKDRIDKLEKGCKGEKT